MTLVRYKEGESEEHEVEINEVPCRTLDSPVIGMRLWCRAPDPVCHPRESGSEGASTSPGRRTVPGRL